MLEIVFDRLVRLMTTSLRNFTSDNVEVSLDNISSVRFGDYLNSIPLPAILAVFRAEELDNYGLLIVDSNLIYSIVDVLLGGRRGTAAMRIEGRPYTTIERVLVQRMVEVVLNDARAAFEPLTPVKSAIARPANAAILVKLRIDMDDRGGRIELLLPYSTLEPIRKMLLQQFMGEKFGRDNIWESHLASELWTTQMEVRAVLDEQQISLRRVLALKVGDTLMLNATPDSLVELRAGTIPLTRGHMGRRGHAIAVRAEAPLNPAARQALKEMR
jgi:flagellar motor switch protein FliM